MYTSLKSTSKIPKELNQAQRAKNQPSRAKSSQKNKIKNKEVNQAQRAKSSLKS